jgi:hypothetical protein
MSVGWNVQIWNQKRKILADIHISFVIAFLNSLENLSSAEKSYEE